VQTKLYYAAERSCCSIIYAHKHIKENLYSALYTEYICVKSTLRSKLLRYNYTHICMRNVDFVQALARGDARLYGAHRTELNPHVDNISTTFHAGGLKGANL